MAPLDTRYTAIIRTDRCDELVRRMVALLQQQTLPPSEIVFVDSSRSPTCSQELQQLGGTVVPYPPEPFNFSKAINVGVAAARHANCLIISSHVLLHEKDFIADGVRAAQQHDCRVLYWAGIPLSGETGYFKITAANFSGNNGLSNSCGMVPTELLRERPFRPEVFSAEDQEWAAWYLRVRKGSSMRAIQPGLEYCNPHMNATKKINEEIAIAYYVYRRNLLPDYIGKRYLRALLAAVRRRPDRARLHWEIAKGLTLAIFRKPVRQSKYF